MLFRQLFDPQSCTYTYLLAKDYGCDALIIDPVIEQIELYQQLLTELDLKLSYTIDTHTHADHITASGELRQLTGCQIIAGEQSQAQGIDRYVSDQDRIDINAISLTALYTPGHTDDCYSYVMGDRVFTGDTLMIRATGRTDFQSGSAEQQYHSLFDTLLKLPANTLVYPGHDYRGITVSTIGEEQRCNPRLQARSLAEYSDIMAQLKLAPPKMIDIALPANLNCGLTVNPTSSTTNNTK